MSELKPCPICGDDNAFVECMDINVYAVRCNECLCTGPTGENVDEEEAESESIQAWNHRPAESKLKAQGYYDAIVEAGVSQSTAKSLAEAYANKLEGEE